MKLLIKVEGDLKGKLGKIEKALKNTSKPLKAATFAFMRQSGKNFENEVDPDGVKWKALKSEPMRPKGRRRKKGEVIPPGVKKFKILNNRGELKKAVIGTSRNAINEVKGTIAFIGIRNLVYANIHNYGGIIRPKKAKALKWQNPKGVWHYAQKVTIPMRKFLGFGKANTDVILDKFKEWIQEVLNS